jgi:hypothetical protein
MLGKLLMYKEGPVEMDKTLEFQKVYKVHEYGVAWQKMSRRAGSTRWTMRDSHEVCLPKEIINMMVEKC